MGRRRFLPLILLVAFGALVLLVRLFDVQVLERDVWTAQADALVREGTVEPYTRGAILDRRGKVLARDAEAYRIETDYRDFRRGNALGIVAHARSSLEMRPVPLAEAREQLVEWALALARLAPEDLARFQRGGALRCGGLEVPATDSPDAQARASRAQDLAFYATALFDLQLRERAHLKKLDDAGRKLGYVELVARERNSTREEAEATLVARCTRDMEFLGDYAALWALDNRVEAADPLVAVIEELERRRDEVEDGAAGDLFEAAAGFPAGRVEAACLAEFFDLEWIRRSLGWDAARLERWCRSARTQWLAQRDGPALDFAVERTRRGLAALPATELVLREVAALFVAPERGDRGVLAAERSWSERGRCVVLGELDTLFAVDLPDGAGDDPRLPLFDRAFASDVARDPQDAGVLAQVEFWRLDQEPIDGALLEGASRAWRARFHSRVDRSELRRGYEALCLRLEDAFQAELRQRLFQVREHAREREELTAGGKLPMADARLERAEERVRYILKDRGSRPFVAVARPSYALVNLLTRYPQHLRGFEVARIHVRVHPTRDAQDRVVARLLVGRLAPPSVARRLSQAELEREIALLEARAGRDEEAEAVLAELRAALDRPDEEVGAFGLERWFEAELAGRNGFREDRGLAEREARARGHARVDKVDGLELTTTLDAALQQAAEYCLEHPEGDPDPEDSDLAWLARPTAALVLLTPEGDVLVAASVPLDARPEEPGRNPVSDDVRERTLTKPDFQPPGSVFKIFVAAFALDRLGLDPFAVCECSRANNAGGRGPGYRGVHCHDTSSGHGNVDLRQALKVSCNSYFAWLGEQYDAASFDRMAREFGFGEPTGVRAFADGNRSGLYEDVVANLFRDPRQDLRGRSLLEAGNGLSVVEATPMQVARATAALASGALPDLRLVSHIGDQELPHNARPLSISRPALELVREAMLAVAGERGGSAHAALSPEKLGFSMAVKTGSADLTSSAVDGSRVLKHTWVAGWFPAENPVGILVVFEHRTTRTSSHGAIWLARQFLKRPEVAAWMAEELSSR